MRTRRLIAAVLAVVSLAMPIAAFAGQVPRTHGRVTKVLLVVPTTEKPGTILISTSARTLDLVLGSGKVARYAIGVGRDGFTWSGIVKVGRKAEWPEWRPPAEMRQRSPDLPDIMPPGPFNPLGIRALYLFKGGEDTLYRIHGTNDGLSIGDSVSSGCFRMTNADILELYDQVEIGAKVVVK